MCDMINDALNKFKKLIDKEEERRLSRKKKRKQTKRTPRSFSGRGDGLRGPIIGMRKGIERKSKSLRSDPRQTFYFRVFLFSYSLRCYKRDALGKEQTASEIDERMDVSFDIRKRSSWTSYGREKGNSMDLRLRSSINFLFFSFSRLYPPRGTKNLLNRLRLSIISFELNMYSVCFVFVLNKINLT